jgi:MerR family transcriptional regulator, copper efflux regulator
MTGHPKTEAVPIACALAPADLAGQAGRWTRLIARSMTARAGTAGGLRLRFRPEAEAELRALAAVESGCCPWASWTVTAGAGEVALDVQAPGEGAAVLREMFRAVPSGGRGSASSPGQARPDGRR